jgi:hypothetical protein
MSYYYDAFGWYVGESGADGRCSEVQPVNASISNAVGELRSNWTGFEWIELPYAALVLPESSDPVPQYITKYQAELYLHRQGLLAGLKAAIATANGETEIAYNATEGFKRDNEILNYFLKDVQGMTDSEIDNWFIEAFKVR